MLVLLDEIIVDDFREALFRVSQQAVELIIAYSFGHHIRSRWRNAAPRQSAALSRTETVPTDDRCRKSICGLHLVESQCESSWRERWFDGGFVVDTVG